MTTLTAVSLTVGSQACDADPAGELASEEYAGKSGLQNLGDGYYQYNWKTPKSYAGSCRLMQLQLGGMTLDAPAQAQFQFTR